MLKNSDHHAEVETARKFYESLGKHRKKIKVTLSSGRVLKTNHLNRSKKK
jgi:hypothetical protein